MKNTPPIKPSDGKLLVLTPGMGAVATTFIAGVEAVRQGNAKPVGSLTQMQAIRIGPRSKNNAPLIKDFLPLAKLEDLTFAGWDVYPDDAYDAAVRADVLKPQDLEPLA
ncbi:MAG: myo-inositol-1-phosphate synthase, partial [Myxococcota bacterium]